ncbi:MAG: lysophospholipid acyltransferase family protein [Desulfobacula sp.]|nr:lysophospholipid acyltransferase family protein [Desulfobacula sp.]
MSKKLKSIIYTQAFMVFLYFFIKIYSMTLRIHIVNEEKWKNLLKKRKPVLLCAWHQQFFSAIHHFSTYAKFNPGIMVSQSKDGQMIAGVANRNGWHTARGSSSRGGKNAMAAMIKHLKKYGFGAHILDGPTGPIGKVKPGAIKIAKETNAFIVPFYITPENAWFFKSWDRFMLPKPFSKVTLTFGDIIQLKDDNDNKSFETQRLMLETTMLPGLYLPKTS